MDVGVFMLFQNHPNLDQTDYQVYKNELKICDMIEPLGFDSLWSVEHHFTNYTMCPNVVQFLSYMAGRTENIKLGSAVIIVPWHKDPMRVATDISMLDNMSDGRMLLGLGRGIGRVEYDGFGIDMNESRGRFHESCEMIMKGLEAGRFEAHEGDYFNQIARDIRPAPLKSFADRTYMACQSPESADVVAEFGAKLMVFAISPWESRAADVGRYREGFRKHHGREPDPITANVFMICDEDAGRAEEMANKYMPDYWQSALQHYEMDGTHFEGIKGFEFYAKSAGTMREMPGDRMGTMYTNNQVHGTPQQCMDQINRIIELAGPINLNVAISFAGMPYDYVEKSVSLFANKVLPELKAIDTTVKAAE